MGRPNCRMISERLFVGVSAGLIEIKMRQRAE